jgi:hypothetical protein
VHMCSRGPQAVQGALHMHVLHAQVQRRVTGEGMGSQLSSINKVYIIDVKSI